MPLLKFSDKELASEPKRKIREALDHVRADVERLNKIAESAEVERSLLAYHVRGSRDAKGLEPLGWSLDCIKPRGGFAPWNLPQMPQSV